MGKIIKYGKKAIETFLIANVIYYGMLISIQKIANFTSPKIRSQGQLEQLVETERRKIDPQNNCNISAALLPGEAGVSGKLDNRHYHIEIGGSHATETTLRHELYHILGGHCEGAGPLQPGFQNKLKYFYWHEPKAIIYQTTGLKP